MTEDHRVGGGLYVFENEYDHVIIHSRTTHLEVYIYPDDLKHLYNCLGQILMRREDESPERRTNEEPKVQ